MTFGRQFLDFNHRRLTGAEPRCVFEATAAGWRIWGGFCASGDGNPWIPLSHFLREAQSRWPEGAALGSVAYEAGYFIEPNASDSAKIAALREPVIRLVFHEQLELSALPEPNVPPPAITDPPDSPQQRDSYRHSIERIQSFIAAGDIYQANLTHRFTVPSRHSPEQLYERLRALGPAPRGAVLLWDDFAVVSNSPESFLTLRDGILTASPIKGTTRRGITPAEDGELKLQLLNSAKDRAENVMIVDLLRNDLGRVCEYGSVHVPELYGVHTFPTLHHLVSTVQGRLRPGLKPLDAFMAAFPCGSITGAPKLQAMKILRELEPVPRGIPMGAIGYFGFDGSMEWNVAIRTAVWRGDYTTFHAGGGIVADSEWEREYEEMRLKARALWSAAQ